MRLTRRAVLAAAGATLALPWLPSLGGSRADGTPPKRLVFLFAPNGFLMDRWRPTTAPALTLGPTMAALAGLEPKLTVVSGLKNESAEPVATGSHARGTGTFLTCVPIDPDSVAAGISVDQVAARTLGRGTPLRSLELAVTGPFGAVGTCEAPYPCAYQHNVAWADAHTPLPPIRSPRLAFRRLFAGTDAGATAALHARLGASVLDVVRDQTEAVAARLGGDDRQRLDAWLTGVRELETRLQTPSTGGACPDAVDPGDDEPALADHADALLDLAVLALACDRTRVVTCMLGTGGTNDVHDHLPGVDTGHHDLSHHGTDASKLAQLATIEAWELGRYARFLQKLDAIAEGEGTLLDRCAVVFGSEVGDGDVHSHSDLPFVVAGSAGGALVTGRHLVVPDPTPVEDFFLALLRAVDAPEASFGAYGSGVLTELLA